jgi:hypothetical protein
MHKSTDSAAQTAELHCDQRAALGQLVAAGDLADAPGHQGEPRKNFRNETFIFASKHAVKY